MSSPLPVTDDPPGIPALRSDSRAMPGPPPPHLLWVRTGTAHVQFTEASGSSGTGTEEFHLTAGDGIWLPAGHHRVITEPGTVVFPLWFDPGTDLGDLAAPVRFRVPDSWQDWLIQHFNLQVTPLGGSGYSPDRIADLVLGARRSGGPGPRGAASGKAGSGGAGADVPDLPTDPAARTVAEELLRDPALDLTVDQWAARVLVSPRTLRRSFRTDTGLTFEQWRLHCRLTASVQYLAAGQRIDRIAGLVGFASRNGFTRAFRTRFGQTPRQFGRTLTTGDLDSGLALHATAVRQAGDLADLARSGVLSPAAPDLLFPARTPPHTNTQHVLSWMYRGSGYLDIGDRHLQRTQGTTTWIPAGAEHVTGIHRDSISLPVATATTADLRLTGPLQVRFPRNWDSYLMYCAVSSRSSLRPENYDPRQVLGLFRTHLAAQQALTLPMPTDPRSRAAALHYLRHMGASGTAHLSAGAGELPGELRTVFREQTGMSFPRWCYAARMRIARDLLAGGASTGAVARRVGYAHLPTFSAAFSRFHGLSPREYQERETSRPR